MTLTSLLRRTRLLTGGAALAAVLSSCLGNDINYNEWRQQNIRYVAEQQNLTAPDGRKVYQTVTAEWAPGLFVLMRWHNDRSLTEKNLQPLYSSKCNVKYYLSTIEEPVDSSYNLVSPADSVYQCRPSSTISGFAIALTNMHVGDSCTVIIPYHAAYGDMTTGSIKKPYSTLIYGLKLVSVPAYEIPN